MVERYTIPQLVFQALCGHPIYSHEGFELAETRIIDTIWMCADCYHMWKPDQGAIKMAWMFDPVFSCIEGARKDYLYASTYCPNCGIKASMCLITMDINQRPYYQNLGRKSK
jgi:hypothetical protein